LNLGCITPPVAESHRFSATLLPMSVTTYVGKMKH
jgi:hypothetical protein